MNLTHVLEDVHVCDSVLKLSPLRYGDEAREVRNHSVHWVNALCLPYQGNLQETSLIKFTQHGIKSFTFRST